MTETSSAIMVTTVGRVVPHVEAKIVDATGATVQIGEAGEILVRGYSTMLGYWAIPKRHPRQSTRKAGCEQATSACSMKVVTVRSSGASKTW